MIKIFCVFILSLVEVLVVSNALSIPNFTTITNQTYCARDVLSANIDGVLTVTSTSACANKESLNLNAITFAISGNPLPYFACNVIQASISSASDFTIMFGFDKIVEYMESGATPGYQSGEDTLVNQFGLNVPASIGTTTSQWTAVQCTQANSTSPIICNTALITNNSSAMIQQINLQAVITTNELQINIPNMPSPVKQVLIPTAVKVSVEIDGIKYTNSSTVIAVGTFVSVINTGVKTQINVGKNLTSNDFQMPNEATNYQGVLQISDSSLASASGFFSWDNFITVQNGTTVTTQNLIVSNATIDSDNPEINSLAKVGYSMYKIWFSPQTQVSNLVWDPTAGVSAGTSTPTASTHTSSATMINFSMVVFAYMLFLGLLLM
jgi:hypothetical protein